MSGDRDKYMRLSTGMHLFNVKGDDTFKAEPDRELLDTQAQMERESKMMTAKVTGVKNVLKPRVSTSSAIASPLDYSYLDIKDISELDEHEPASGTPKPKPIETEDKVSTPHQPTPKKNQIQLRTTGLRLGYNHLTALPPDTAEHVNKVLDNPHDNLMMLDLCCNKLQTIPDLRAFPNLSVLYLHGNNITKISEVKKLRHLKNLSKLTLHGNAIFYEATESQGRRAERLEDCNYYRPRIIYYLRNTALKSLDNISITPKDRETALIWYNNHAPKKRD